MMLPPTKGVCVHCKAPISYSHAFGRWKHDSKKPGVWGKVGCGSFRDQLKTSATPMLNIIVPVCEEEV